SRDLRISTEWPMGLNCSLARSGTAWAQARVPVAARAGAQLHRRLRRLHRAREGLWRRGSQDRNAEVRLAFFRKKPVAGRADADRLAAQEDSEFNGPLSQIEEVVRRVSQDAQRRKAYLLSRQREVDASTEDV